MESLMYLTATRPDIMYFANLISRYMENPTKMHLLVAKKNPSLLAKCRNLPFGGRATRDSRVHLPRKDYVRSHHQRLRKTSEKPKKTWSTNFK